MVKCVKLVRSNKIFAHARTGNFRDRVRVIRGPCAGMGNDRYNIKMVEMGWRRCNLAPGNKSS